MKKIILLTLTAYAAWAQNTGCFSATGSTYPCSLIPTVLEAQAVNVKVSAGAGTTLTQAFGSATSKGNTIVCLGIESVNAVPVFTDGDGNTFVVVKSNGSSAPGYSIVVANNIAGTSSDVITLATSSGAAAFACHELKGAVTVGQAWDLFDAQQAAAATITFNPTIATIPGEMIFAAAGFTTGITVNATPSLGGNATGLVTVDAGNTAVSGGSALAVFYAAHTTVNTTSAFSQTLTLSGSATFTGLLVSIKPPALPSNPLPFLTGTLQNAATASGNGATLNVSGTADAVITVNCSVACTGGTMVNFEATQDGTNWSAVNAIKAGTNIVSTYVLNQNTTPTNWEFPIAGYAAIRARISGYSAGTVTVTATAVSIPYTPQTIIAGSMPANGQTTYAASKVGLAPAASPTDIAVLSGNATNVVTPIYVSVSCTQTTSGIIDIQLLIRTTADSAGTSTGSPTTFPMDQNNLAAVSSVLTYTANPTVNDGTTRVIDSQKIAALAPATASPNDIYIWKPTMGQSVILRGTAQQLAVNLNGVSLSGGSCDVTFRWIESLGL